MKTNMSGLDRIIRALLGAVLLVLYFTATVTGALGIVVLVVGVLALVTGAVGFCPMYALLKIKTSKS